MKKLLAIILCVAVLLTIGAACGKDEDENYDTGDASLDKIRNEDPFIL